MVGLGILITVFLLPEANRFSKNNAKKSQLEYLQNAYKFYTKKKHSAKGERWQYILCILIFLLVMSAIMGKMTSETLYVLDSPFVGRL